MKTAAKRNGSLRTDGLSSAGASIQEVARHEPEALFRRVVLPLDTVLKHPQLTKGMNTASLRALLAQYFERIRQLESRQP